MKTCVTTSNFPLNRKRRARVVENKKKKKPIKQEVHWQIEKGERGK